MTQAEFLDWAGRQDLKYEYDGTRPVLKNAFIEADGTVTGGTNNHGLIAGNLFFELMARLRGTACTPMLPEGGIATVGTRMRFPDATVTCSPLAGHARLIPNPAAVFEVISPSSVHMDRLIKLREYHAVPSIRHYVLLEQDAIGLTLHTRHGDAWITTPLIDADTLFLPGIGPEPGIRIPVAAFYTGITFDLAHNPDPAPDPTPEPRP